LYDTVLCYFQDGACVEVFSAQEKSPLAQWNVSGIKKVNNDTCALNI